MVCGNFILPEPASYVFFYAFSNLRNLLYIIRMDYSLLIAYLRQKQYITDLEKDILDTWNELQKSPFDRSSAQLQIMQNNAKHPEILAAIKALPTTVIRPFDQVTENDIRYNLGEQLEALAMKEGWPTNG